MTFTYKANDSHVDSNTSTVTINVTQANRPPVAVGDSAQAKPAQQISVDVAANDSDPDGDALSYAVNGQPVHGTASCTTVGTCSYQSVGGYSGGDSFTYTVSDGHGHTVGATVAITVAANASPIATNDSVSTTTNHEVTVAVGANDSDPNSDPLTFAKTTDPSHGTATCTSAGSCSYTPATDYVGSDSFTYTVSDGFGGQAVGTVSVTVKAPGSVSAGRRRPAARSVTSPLKVTGSAAPVQPGSTVALQRLNGSTGSRWPARSSRPPAATPSR